MTQVKEERIEKKIIRQIFFDITKIQNQVAKWKLTLIGKVTCNSNEQLPTKLLTERRNNKRQVRGILHSNNKTPMHNIVLIVPAVDWYGSLKLWEHFALDDRYWKYLIYLIGNTPTPPPITLPSTNTKISQRPSSPSPTRHSQAPPTFPTPRKSTRPSPISSPREAPTPSIAHTLIYDTDGVVKTIRDSMAILLLTGRPT